MATKIKFVSEMQLASVEMAQLADRLTDMRATYFDRAYGASAANEITDGDVSSLNTSASDVGAMVTMIENFEYFLTSASISVADYSATLNRMRTDI